MDFKIYLFFLIFHSFHLHNYYM